MCARISMKKENITIRPLRKNDIPVACTMIRKLAAHFGDRAKVTPQDILKNSFGSKKISTILLAVLGNKPVGFAITRDWMNFYLGVKFKHIDFIYVEQTYRKKGIGLMLMKAVAKKAVKEGCQRLSLDVGHANTSALVLYQKLGFEKRADISANYRLSDEALIELAKEA